MMAIRLWILTLFCICVVFASAQYTMSNKVWAFGQNAGLDFNSGKPVPIATSIGGFGEGAASVCDRNGNLLFYSEGSTIWAGNGTVLQNGQAITGIPNFGNNYSATTSTVQGVQIVPWPDSPQLYFVFSLSSIELGDDAGKLFYSVVDMRLNGGKGAIVGSQKGILLETGLNESMTAVTGDRCNIWLLVQTNAGSVKAFSVSAAGVNTVPVVSAMGYSLSGTANMKVSHNRKKLATVSGSNGGRLLIADFDAFTGKVSAVASIVVQSYYGLAFSAADTKLYASRGSDIHQYDLLAGTPQQILNSRAQVGNCHNATLALGPDGKVYFRNRILFRTVDNTFSNVIGCINEPEMAGAACNYSDSVLTLLPGTTANWGFPADVPLFIKDTANTIQSLTGVCFQPTSVVVLKAIDSTGWDYKWQNADSATTQSVNNSGVFFVKYHTASCVLHNDNFRVKIPYRAPAIGIGLACAGQNKVWIRPQLTDTSLYTYKWMASDGQTVQIRTGIGGDSTTNLPVGNYTLRLSDMFGCDTIYQFVIEASGLNAAFTAPSSVCVGDSIYFTNTSSATFTNYQWAFGDGENAISASPAHLYKKAGNYSVRMIGFTAEGCSDTASANVLVDSIPVINAVTSKSTACAGATINFTVQHNSNATTFRWIFGDSTSSASGSFARIFEEAGIYPFALVASSAVGCVSDTAKGVIQIYEQPNVYTGPDLITQPGKPITLMATVNSGNYSLLWSPAVFLSSATVLQPTAAPPTDQLYTLTATGEGGCTATDNVLVKVFTGIHIPNAFSPNGDGVNDVWNIRGLRVYQNAKTEVFNRWGQKVFESAGYITPWDGTVKGKPVPVGVYYYIIRINDNGYDTLTGSLTILR